MKLSFIVLFAIPFLISCGKCATISSNQTTTGSKAAYKNMCQINSSNFSNNPYNTCTNKCSNGSTPIGNRCSDGSTPTYSCNNPQNRCVDGSAPDYNGICSNGYCVNGRYPSYRNGQLSCY